MAGLFSTQPLGNGGVLGGLMGNGEPQSDARMAMMAQLLQGGGYSPQRQTFGEIMGKALMAGQAARQQSIQSQQARDAADLDKKYREAQIQHMQDGTDPASVREYAFAKANGYTGTYEEWTKMNGQTSRPSSVQEWEFFNGLKEKDQARYLEMKRNPNWKVGEVNQVPTVIQGGPGGAVQTTPLSTTGSEAAAAGQVKGAEAQAGAVGTGMGNITADIQKKGSNAAVVKGLVGDARGILQDENTTGSAGGTAMDALGAVVGHSTSGAQNTAKLKVIQSGLMLNMPRMEGPQSDRDVQLYQQAAAQIGDSSVPRETRAAALDTIEAIQDRYAERAAASAQSAAPAGTRKKRYNPATGRIE